jgi:hypothetical protein
MKLTFLGTRGYIEPQTVRHHMHSSLMISYYGTDVVIDCGEDWLGKVGSWNAEAIFVTQLIQITLAGSKRVPRARCMPRRRPGNRW